MNSNLPTLTHATVPAATNDIRAIKPPFLIPNWWLWVWWGPHQTHSHQLGISKGGLMARMSFVAAGTVACVSVGRLEFIRAGGVFRAFQRSGPGPTNKADRCAIESNQFSQSETPGAIPPAPSPDVARRLHACGDRRC